ncbi:signal transducing kinase of the PAK, partial [Mortierella alpina]
LNSVLGKGAYKIVYKGIDREEGYEVAWNCFQTTKQEYAELSQEVEILKRVRHPNIINFHDCWYSNTEFIFITELMTSGTLREYIRKLQTPNLKVVKRWCRQILKGLIYLHSYDPPIIHRDIKCDNIFINGAHGEVKIGDMGTAKMKIGKKYTVIGTPEFMAPEMYEEMGYSEKVDIYAFGMCLLEMVTGDYPYNECKNAAQIYKKVTQEAIEDPFLGVEPEVVVLSTDEQKTHLVLQVVFKGMDKLSVKFEFNVDTDTAEEVVNEMSLTVTLWGPSHIWPLIPQADIHVDAPIEDLVHDTAMAYHRGPDKAKEWLAKLKNQDIMTIGDLKDLQDSDWAGFDLTVFASRALRNRLFGKNIKRPTNGLTRNSSGGTTDDGLS